MPLIEQAQPITLIPSDAERITVEPSSYSELIAKKAAKVQESTGGDYQQALQRYQVMSSTGSSEAIREEVKTQDLLERRSVIAKSVADAMSSGTPEVVATQLQAYAFEQAKDDALERKYLASIENRMPDDLKELDAANPDLYTRKRNQALFMQHVQTEMARVGVLEADENLVQEAFDFGKTIFGIPNLLDNNNPWEGTLGTQIDNIKKDLAFIKSQPSEDQPVLLKELTGRLLDSRIFDNPQDVLDLYGLALSSSIDVNNSVFLANSLDSLFLLGELKLIQAGTTALKTSISKKASEDIILHQTTAGNDAIAEDILSGAGKIVEDMDAAADLMPFLRNPDSIVSGVSEAVSNRILQNQSEILRVIENFSAPERIHELAARQATDFSDNVVGRQLIDSTVDSETGNVIFTFGTTKGVPFKSEAAARKAAESKGIQDFTIQQSSSGYIVKVNTQTPDIAKGFNEVGMIGKNFGNVSDVVKSLLPIAQRSEDAAGAVSKVVQNIINKDLAPFVSGKKAIPLNNTLEEMAKERTWYNMQEFNTVFERLNGRFPTDAEVKAYVAHGQLNDLSYFLSVKPVLDDVATRGDEVFELAGLVDDTAKLGIAGRVVDDSIILGKNSNLEGVMLWNERASFIDKGTASLDDLKGLTFIEINPRWTQHFMELGHTNHPVKYLAVPASTPKRKIIPTDVLNYSGGPRTSNASPFFIKSAQFAEDASGKLYRLQDVTLASASSVKQGAEGAAKMESLVKLMRANKDDLGKLTDDAVEGIGLRAFGIDSVASANKWMIRHGLYKRSVQIASVGNREIVQADEALKRLFGGREVKVDDVAFSSPHSLSLFGARTKEGIRHISGEESTMLSPMAALAESMDKAINYSTGAAFRERSLLFMRTQMAKYLDTASSNPYALLTANVLSSVQRTQPRIANAVEAHQRFLINMLGQPSRFETTWGQFVDRAAGSIFDMKDRFFGKGGLTAKQEKDILEGRQKVVDVFGKDPITKVRSLTFHSTLGLFSLPSFIMQAINVVNIAAISPKYGSKAALQAPILRMALFAHDKQSLDLIAKYHGVLGFKSADEFKQYVLEFKNLGFDHIGNNHALIAGLSGAQVNTSMLSRFADRGRWFFDQGELLNRLTAYGAARKQWDEAVGLGKAADSPEGREWIGKETHRLTLGMSGADLQIGLRNSLISIPTQFMSYPLRFLNAITPDLKILKGSQSFTSKEKRNLILMNIAMFGGAGVPLFDTVADYLTEKYKMDPVLSKQLTNGLIDSILYAASEGEINSNFSGRAGNAEFLNQLMDAATGDKNFLELLGGASGSKLAGFHSSLDEFYGLMKAMVNPDFASVKDASVQLFVENISSLKGINRAFLAYTEGLLYSKHGNKLAHISKGGAIAMALGLPPQAYEDIGAALARKETRDELIKEQAGHRLKQIQRLARTSSAEERKIIEQEIMYHSLLMSTQGMELDIAQRVLSEQGRGTMLEYLVKEEQQLKASKPEEGRQDFSEQFIQQNIEDQEK